MKRLGIFLLAACGMFAADFVTGQGARAIIGQPSFTAQFPEQPDRYNTTYTPPELIIGGMSGLAYVNNTLFVADSNRIGASPVYNRVLIYNNVSGFLPAPADEVPQYVSDDAPGGARCPLCRGSASIVLGQTDFTSKDYHLSQSGLRTPTGVATDGVRLAVADSDNNRVLIWNNIPTENNTPADVVLGQADFVSNTPNAGTGDSRVPSARSLRGPAGVWIQGSKIFVADDLNHRVLIWNSIPTENFKEADVVLGQPNFSSVIEPDLTKSTITAAANTLLNPVSVTSDGVRLFVSDLGHNRVLIWDSIPTQNQAAADHVIGQPDMTTAVSNYTGSGGVCPTLKDEDGKTITDDDGDDTYPYLCGATLNFPRFALSDGVRLFVADGGNDRVLIFNQIPTTDGASADIVLGQIDDQHVQTSDDDSYTALVLRRASADSVRTPMSLAWDGTNLYVSEPYSRRIMIFTPGFPKLALSAMRNAASLVVYAMGTVTFSGAAAEDDKIKITIQGTEYTYKVKEDDTAENILNGLADAINAGDGDPYVIASVNVLSATLLLSARAGGEAGNEITLEASVSPSTSELTATASGSTLEGASDTTRITPGMLVSIFGENLTDQTASAPAGVDPLPTKLAGVQLYVDGRPAPLLSVSPTQVNAQIPFETYEDTSASVYIRAERADGTVTTTTALGAPIVAGNPGVFAYPGDDPRTAVALHADSQANGTVIIEGASNEGDIATVTIEDRSYNYTMVEDDTLYMIRDKLIELINASDPLVYAEPTGQWTYIKLYSKIEGPAGEGIPYSVSTHDSEYLTMSTTGSVLRGANVAGALVTPENPAVPGETITVYAAGLGMVNGEGDTEEHYYEVVNNIVTGFTYKGPEVNRATESVNAVAGGRTAGTYYAGMMQGQVGIYKINMELNAELTTNPLTQCWIGQDVYRSNVVTIPVQRPGP